MTAAPAAMRRGRRAALRGLVGAAATLAFAQVAQPANRRAHPKALPIGVLLPRSGYLASAGAACDRGVGLMRALRAELDLPSFTTLDVDTGESPASAVEAATRAIDAGARLLIGCYDSAQTVEVAALAERRRTPLVVNVAAAPTITRSGYRHVFRNFPDADRIVTDSYVLQKQLFARTGWTPRRVAVLHIDNGRGIEAIVEQFAEMSMPYTLAPPIAYDPRASDLSHVVERAQGTGADALWTVSRSEDAVRIARELLRLDWTPGALMSSNAGLYEPAYVAALGRNAEHALTFAPFYDPNKPLTQRLRAQLERSEPNVPLGTLETYTFEALLVALDAFARAGSFAPDRLVEALRATDLRENVTPGPGVRFDAQGQNRALGLVAIQTRNGGGRVVLPTAAADAEPIAPMPAWRERRS